MAALINLLPLALEGQWRGWAGAGIVMTAVTLLIGSIFILLWGIYGAKVGYFVLGTSLFGFIIILSLMWLVGAPGTIPGTGPRGTEPHWVPFLAESEQGRELASAIEAFPQSWDEIGKKYPGGIDSGGEFETAKDTIETALARLAEFQGLPATEPEDWDFRLAETDVVAGEEELPAATVRFFQKDTPLLVGIQIPATDKHREITVFGLRDKGKVFQPAAIFLVVSILAFVVHVAALARIEKREEQRAGEPSQREPAKV